jgi:hypothetical protein
VSASPSITGLPLGCGQRVARKGNRDKAASGQIPWIGGGHRDLDRGGAHGDIDRHGIVPEINLVPSTVRASQNGKQETFPLSLIGRA